MLREAAPVQNVRRVALREALLFAEGELKGTAKESQWLSGYAAGVIVIRNAIQAIMDEHN